MSGVDRDAHRRRSRRHENRSDRADGHGATLLRRRVPTPAGDYRGTIEAIASLVETAEQELGAAAGVGIATPGTVSRRSGTMKNSNSTALNGQPLARDLEARLRRPLRLANDANCFALSEAVDGAAAGAANVFGVILGTGAGGGVVIDGAVVAGRDGIAGEWGHNPLPWPRDDERPGPLCYCGKHGCIETFVSGPAFARSFYERSGRSLAPGAIVTEAATSALAHAELERYLDRLARGLACTINLLDPDVIVLGGGLSKIDALYERLPALVGSYVFSDGFDTPILRALHGDSSGVRGAAWLWLPPRPEEDDPRIEIV